MHLNRVSQSVLSDMSAAAVQIGPVVPNGAGATDRAEGGKLHGERFNDANGRKFVALCGSLCTSNFVYHYVCSDQVHCQ